jgi:hypothetical protein
MRLSKDLSKPKKIACCWADAIKDTENEILTIIKQEKRLRQALRIFRANKKDGVPWPNADRSADTGPPAR